MSKFNFFVGCSISFIQETLKIVKFWGPHDTNLEWARFIKLSSRYIEIIEHGKSGRKQYIACSTEILPIRDGSIIQVHGDLGNKIGHNCTIHAGSGNVSTYEWSLQLGTRV